MLPDYARAKHLIHELMLKALHMRMRSYQGPLALKEYRAFEGRSFATKTTDGKLLRSEAKEMSAKVAVRLQDIQSADSGRIIEHLDAIAKQMADSQIGLLFEQVTKTCQETGNTFDNGGGPLRAELLFQMVEGTDFEFESDGAPLRMSFYFGPQLSERFKEIFKEIEADSILSRRWSDLLNKKREEWRDREAARKMVG